MNNLINKTKKHWKTGLGYGLGLSRSPGGPINVHIETTNICNFKCIYCPQSKPEEHFSVIGKGKMSFEDYCTIVDKILKTWSIDEIILTRDGEPLVHPELEKFIEYASKKSLTVTIGSNGSYFSKDRVKKLIESGLSKVKGDFCVNKKQYEELRIGGKWEEVYHGYKNLLDYAILHNKSFHLVIVDLNTYYAKNQEEVENSLDRMRDLFPYPENYLSLNPAIMHNSFDQAQVILSTSNNVYQSKYNLCHHPWVELVIDYKGNAVGCCRDLRSEYIIGNLLNSDDIVNDIWNGEKMRFLRRQLAKKNPDMISTCSKCDLPYGTSYAGSSFSNKIKRFLSR